MTQLHQRRLWFWIAALALVAAVALLLVPHSGTSHASDWLAILPIYFVGFISPLILLGFTIFPEIGVVPSTLALPVTFQRPPPSHRD